MYDNIGGKCKVLASVIFFAGVALGVVSGLILIVMGIENGGRNANMVLVVIGIGSAVLCPLLGWLCSIPIYAIGHAADNSELAVEIAARADARRIREQRGTEGEKTAKMPRKPGQYPGEPVWVACPECGAMNNINEDTVCFECGEPLV